MPLKLVEPRKGKSPNYTIRGTYLRVRVNQSASVSKRAVAQEVLKKIERQIERGEFADGRDKTFAEAAAAYMEAGGERTYLTKLLRHFGETAINRIDQDAVDRAALELYPRGTPATRSRSVYTPISAVLTHAGRAPRLRRPVGSEGNKATAWLWPEQATALIKEAHKLNPDFAALIVVLLYTGMRLSEALNLTWNDIRMEEGFAYVPDTKNDQPRAVFLPPVAVAALENLDPRRQSRPFKFSKGGHIYSLLKTAAWKASVDLPSRSAFHIFRHTYATWMRRYAGADRQGLIATGAWKDGKSVDRYTHTVVNEEARRAALLPVAVSGIVVENEYPLIGEIDKSNG